MQLKRLNGTTGGSAIRIARVEYGGSVAVCGVLLPLLVVVSAANIVLQTLVPAGYCYNCSRGCDVQQNIVISTVLHCIACCTVWHCLQLFANIVGSHENAPNLGALGALYLPPFGSKWEQLAPVHLGAIGSACVR